MAWARPGHQQYHSMPLKYTPNLKTPLLPLKETTVLFFSNATHFEEQFVLAVGTNTKLAKGAIQAK